LQCIEEHQAADQSYLDQGIDLLELVSRAHELFEKQVAHEKQRLLKFVISNCTWKGGELQPKFRQPFDLLADTCAAMRKPVGSAGVETGLNEEWLPFVNSYRNLCLAPTPELKLVFSMMRYACGGLSSSQSCL
jgi:hypothetical protein